MNKILRVGKFLRILDSTNNLSISNITLIIIITKIAMAPVNSIQDAGLAIAAILPYAAKKMKGNQ